MNKKQRTAAKKAKKAERPPIVRAQQGYHMGVNPTNPDGSELVQLYNFTSNANKAAKSGRMLELIEQNNVTDYTILKMEVD